MPVAAAVPLPGPATPPPPPHFRNVLDELAAMEEQELATIHEQEDDDAFEDVFGHGEGGLGAAPPKRACRRPEAVPAEPQEAAPDEVQQEVPDGPPAKRARASSDKAQPLHAVQTVVPASLEGLECRLEHAGEVPRFRTSDAGGLVHRCMAFDAQVRFWPSTLDWCVEGPDGGIVEAVLATPLHSAT